MNPAENLAVESDERFPSGPWTGFFLQPDRPGRHRMDMILTFREGLITGEGHDRIGEFVFKGRYRVEEGKCWWTKTYLRRHDVAYQGFNEGKGIWGMWESAPNFRGGFHIWPLAMGDPTQGRLTEAIEEPTGPGIGPPSEPILAPGIPDEMAEPVTAGATSGAFSATRGH